MASSGSKRKVPPTDMPTSPPSKRRFEEGSIDADNSAQATTSTNHADSSAVPAEAPSTIVQDSSVTSTLAQRLAERQARYAALKVAQLASRDQNRKETAAEASRLAIDPAEDNALSRKRAIASHKLLKAETAAEGEDFERKRAWDWTVDESEKWDRRLAKKEKHREDVAFRGYGQEANKVYKRQLKQLGNPDVEAYEKEKQDAIERATKSGRLEVVETDDGELVAVDKDGTFYSSAESTEFVNNKPKKENVDRLVADLRKADDMRMKKRKERSGRGDDDGDVTFINEKNKQFNMKLARFYNKYTQDIRDSFERGTAI